MSFSYSFRGSWCDHVRQTFTSLQQQEEKGFHLVSGTILEQAHFFGSVAFRFLNKVTAINGFVIMLRQDPIASRSHKLIDQM